MVKNNLEEMKKKYVLGVSAIGLIAILICFFGMIQMIQYESHITQVNSNLEKSLETNLMLNNQLLTQTLDNQMLKQDLNTCVLAYNQLYDQAMYLYNQLQDVNQ